MAELNELDTLLLQAGVTVTQNSGPSIDPELTKMYADVLKDAHRKLVAEYNAKREMNAEFEAFRAREQSKVLESKHRTREFEKTNRQSAYSDAPQVDLYDLVTNQLPSLFGPNSDAAKANALAKQDIFLYRFLQGEARKRGVTR
jgi:hypothetical protein